MQASPPRLLVHHPENPSREFPLKQLEIVIGRDPASHLALDDRKISRSHARILEREGCFTIRDLGSRNGTYVNSRKIGPEDGEVALADGDRIRVGSHIVECEFRGVSEERESSGIRESEKTHIARNLSQQLLDPPEDLQDEGTEEVEWPPPPDESPGDELETGVIRHKDVEEAKEQAESVELELRPSELDVIREEVMDDDSASTVMKEPSKSESEKEESPDPDEDTSVVPQVTGDTSYDIMSDLEELREARARVIVCRDENGAESLPVERRRVTIGRGRHNDMVISHHTVSSVHAEIQFSPQGFTLVDKNSTNGTYVDNARIRSSRLRDGAYLMFGGVMGLFLHDEDLDAAKERTEAAKISDALVRGGILGRARLKEALGEAESSGRRLSEVLLPGGDVTPAEWWEASRMAGPDRVRSNPAPIFVPILIVAALVIAAAAFVIYFLG